MAVTERDGPEYPEDPTTGPSFVGLVINLTVAALVLMALLAAAALLGVIVGVGVESYMWVRGA